MKLLKSKKAEGYITPCVLIIVFVAIFSIIFTYSASVSKVKLMRENTKVVLDSFVTQNSTEIYNSIKQGNDYTEVIDAEEFRTSLISFCTLEIDNGMLYSIDADGQELFHISEPTLGFREANELELVVNYTITVPMWFAGNEFPAVSIPIEVTSILTEKF
ncbi:MAG: hypothetical protein J6V06_07570 [Clostridia bacterium]|nr:hypothetical protein [Clostridia bacterium]